MHTLTLLRRLGAATLSSCLATAQVSYFSATLDGAQEVPPVPGNGGGYAIVRLEEPANTVRIFTHYFGLSGAPAAAHMHQAPAGANGGVIVGLSAGPANTFTGSGTLTPAQVAALKSAGMYVNVHTAAFPGGEVRGQVVEATSRRFTAVMNGLQEVPPNPSTATGRVVAFLHQPDDRLVYSVESNGLANVTAAHLHQAAPGVNGPIVFGLNGGAGQYCGVSPRLSAAQLAALLAGNTYMNIHTAAFGGGEIRGQMIADQGDHFVAELDSAQEVPPNPSPGLGAASVVLDEAGVGSVVVSFAGLTGAPIAAHIHNAPAGVNGPVVVPLSLVGGNYVATFTPSTSDLVQLRGGNWYVNIHTAAFGGGEIRGQLLAADLPAPYGPSCLGSNGQRPAIGATGIPVLGTSFDVDLYGALPGAPSFLLFGFNRDSAAGNPLPLSFTLVGLNAPCFFLLDPVASLLLFADGMGCASSPFAVPFAPPLRGLDVFAQWVLLDGAANPAGFVASNALSFTLQ